MLLLRGVCSKFTPRFGGTGRLGTTVALPPFPTGRSPLTRLDVGSGTISPAPCGARAAGAEGRDGAGLGRDVYSLFRRLHAPRPLLSHWPLASQLLLTGLAAVARSPGRRVAAGWEAWGGASPDPGWCRPLPPRDRGTHYDQSRQQLRRES